MVNSATAAVSWTIEDAPVVVQRALSSHMCERHHGHAEWRENGERIPAFPLRLALGCAPTI